jgi:hypothetical protein
MCIGFKGYELRLSSSIESAKPLHVVSHDVPFLELRHPSADKTHHHTRHGRELPCEPRHKNGRKSRHHTDCHKPHCDRILSTTTPKCACLSLYRFIFPPAHGDTIYTKKERSILFIVFLPLLLGEFSLPSFFLFLQYRTFLKQNVQFFFPIMLRLIATNSTRHRTVILNSSSSSLVQNATIVSSITGGGNGIGGGSYIMNRVAATTNIRSVLMSTGSITVSKPISIRLSKLPPPPPLPLQIHHYYILIMIVLASFLFVWNW